MPDDHVVLAWLVLWAVASVNLGRKGVDGKTAYELRAGRPWKRPLAQFGE